MGRRILWFIPRIAALLAVLVVARLPVGPTPGMMARVRVMHASPDTPEVDVYMNGSKVLSGVAYFSISRYLFMPSGAFRVHVARAGQPASKAMIDATITLDGGKDYTLAAIDVHKHIRPLVLVDNNAVSQDGRARVRIIHASPDGPQIAVRDKDARNVVVTNLAFGEAQYFEMSSGTYQLEIISVEERGSGAVLTTSDKLRFESGWGYTLVVSNVVEHLWVQAHIDQVER